MARILSIEIGYSITRICEMDYRTKNPKVYKYASLPTPQGVLNDGYLADRDGFGADLMSVLRSEKINTKMAVFSVTSSKIITREVILPAVKMSQIAALVKANATDYFPIDLTEYEIAHLVLGVEKGEDKKDKYRVLVMAAEKKLIAGYEKLAARCGMRMISMDFSGNSIYQVMRNECKEETEMVIKVEEQSTLAAVISEGNLVLQRNVIYGVNDAIRAALQAPVFKVNSYEDALDLMKRKTCIKVVLSEQTHMVEDEYDYDENEVVFRAKQEVTSSLAQLINNVARVVDFYNSKNHEKPIKKIRLIGLGADISGLSKLFTNELGISTAVLSNLDSVSWNRTEGEGNPGRYMAAIGASFAPVGFINEETLKKELQNINYRNMSILIGTLFAVVSITISVLAIWNYNNALKENERLTRMEAEYIQAEAIYNEYSSVAAFYAEVENGYKQTLHPNDNLVAFLTELEQKLPADAIVTDLTSNSEQASIQIKVMNKEEAAKVIQTLRDFDSVMDVSLGSVDKEESEDEDKFADSMNSESAEGEEEAPETDENGNPIEKVPMVTFRIICTYYPVNTEAAGSASTN